MSDVPYAEWADYIAKLVGDRRRGRDVGCGTGKFTVALKNAGYDVAGSDVSPEMLTKAAEFAKRSGTDAKRGQTRGRAPARLRYRVLRRGELP